MILKNENDFEKWKRIWKMKMNLKNENEFEKLKWIWKVKMNLNIYTFSGVRYDTTLLYPQLSPDAIATPRVRDNRLAIDGYVADSSQQGRQRYCQPLPGGAGRCYRHNGRCWSLSRPQAEYSTQK
jgi:hypothetical protein